MAACGGPSWEWSAPLGIDQEWLNRSSRLHGQRGPENKASPCQAGGSEMSADTRINVLLWGIRLNSEGGKIKAGCDPDGQAPNWAAQDSSDVIRAKLQGACLANRGAKWRIIMRNYIIGRIRFGHQLKERLKTSCSSLSFFLFFFTAALGYTFLFFLWLQHMSVWPPLG